MYLTNVGDFSFARSLVIQHKCRNVLATCYDDLETLRGKYPSVTGNISSILDPRSSRGENQSEAEAGKKEEEREREREENQDPKPPKTTGSKTTNTRVLYSIDARKLGSPGGGGKEVRTGFGFRSGPNPKPDPWSRPHQHQQDKKNPAGGPWDVICFNFPHVGGLSTDVNRQVRSNQELLVGFFKAGVSLLATSQMGDEQDEDEDEGEGEEFGSVSDLDSDAGSKKWQRNQGQILVTLFEGEPYTLWNIKDLARHAGLRVVTSFRFPWAAYEGYSHARTLGEIEGKHGGKGGWRGEDREARMYVFENAQVEPKPRPPKQKKKKRGRNESDSESD